MSDGLPVQCQPKLPMRRPKVTKPSNEIPTSSTAVANKPADIPTIQSIQIGSTTITLHTPSMKQGVPLSLVNVGTKLPVTAQSVVSIVDSDGSDRDEAEGDEEELIHSEEDEEENASATQTTDPLSESTLDIATSSPGTTTLKECTTQSSEPDSTTSAGSADPPSVQSSDEQTAGQSTEETPKEVEVQAAAVEKPVEEASDEISDQPAHEDTMKEEEDKKEDEKKSDTKETEPSVPIRQ